MHGVLILFSNLHTTGSEPITNANDNKMMAQVVLKLEDVAVPPTNLTEPEIQEFEVTVKAGDTELYTVPKQIHVDVRPAFTNFVRQHCG